MSITSRHSEVDAVPDDCQEKPSEGSAALWSVPFVLLCVPMGSLVGTLLGFLEDFGPSHTVESAA